MWLALDVLQPIAHQTAEILVGIQHLSIEIEFDDRQGGIERAQLVLVVKREKFGGGNIGGDLHDFDHFAVRKNWIVGGFDIHILPGFGKTPELPHLWLSGRQFPPESFVGRRCG